LDIMSTRMDKRTIRNAALAARRAMPPPDRILADTAIARTAAVMAAHDAVICAYAPMVGEPGGGTLLPSLRSTGRLVLLPVLRADHDLEWAAFEGELGATDRAGVRAPTTPVQPVETIAMAGLIFVPALGVDQAGVRLGRGGGSFDRALRRAQPGALIVALIYEHELYDDLPAEAHDVPVDLVVTQSGVRPVPW
jgi:5-formyltetrahydrofolate cyclo-ligase